MKILVTGCTGYIGSQTVVQLLQAGHEVVILDDLSDSKPSVVDHIECIAGKRPALIHGDIRDWDTLEQLFAQHSIDAVTHFACLKAVGESEAEPLKYFHTNVAGSIALFDEAGRARVRTAVFFSSSATVYGDLGCPQYREDSPLAPVKIYGRTKLMVEDVLRKRHRTQPDWQIVLLRYFNPVGAHKSGLIGEDASGIQNNLMPFIAQVDSTEREKLTVLSNDYSAPDSTELRDHIHVEAQVAGHLAALEVLHAREGIITLNLGTGRAISMLRVLAGFEKISGRVIHFEVTKRRSGALAAYFADPSLARKTLRWRAKHRIEEMCRDTWHWQQSRLS